MVFKYLLSPDDPYINSRPVKITVRHRGIAKIVRVRTHSNGDI